MEQITLSDRAKKLSYVLLMPLARGLHRVGVSPDAVTLAGLAVVAFGAWRVIEGAWIQAAIIFLLALPLDTLDGAVARLHAEFRPFGSFLDSTLDRYADALILGGIGLYYARADALLFVGAAFVALHGALMVSYLRAKAESLSISCKIGLFTRFERLTVVLVALLGTLIAGQTSLDIGIMVLAVGTQYTALERLWYVGRALRRSATIQEEK
ncbi:MAG: CDP-alcohol phosphatidyltransferase family protein [Anaerolineales bacterium]